MPDQTGGMAMSSFRMFRNSELFWAFTISVLIVFFEMPAWAQGAALVCIIWRLLIERAQFSIPRRRDFAILVGLLVTLVIVEFRTLLGRDASGTLFFVLLTLKVLESKSDRDRNFIWLLILGLVHIRFLYSLEVYALPITQAAVVLVLLDILKQFWPTNLAQRTRFVLKSVFVMSPLVLALFFLFPRTQTPWGFAGKSTAVSGFSDSLNAGEISELSQSNELAFRARFIDGEKRKISELYWVGTRLYESNGLSWSGQFRPLSLSKNDSQSASNYEIHLEPHYKTWLFTLEGTNAIRNEESRVQDVNVRDDGIFRARFPIDRDIFYEGVIGFADDITEGNELLQFPKLEPELETFIKAEIQKKPVPTDQVQEVKKFFLRHDFTYTLNPDSDSETLKEFLMQSKKGFCGHFAGAVGTILRLFGVKSRVVTGYQGGVYNPYGDFWSVFQRDAHAWVEFLDENNQWRTFDIVEFIAPLRIDFGSIDFSNLPSEFAKSANRNLRRSSWTARLWEDAMFLAESVNYQWTMFLIEFNKGNQQQILREMLPFIGWVLVLVISVLFLSSLIQLWIRGSRRPLIEKFLHKLERETAAKGILRLPHETPLSYLKRCEDRWPEFKSLWAKASQIYIDISLREIRSQENVSQVLKQLKKQVRTS